MVFYPPHQSQNLYPMANFNLYQGACFDPRNPDFKKFARAKEATPFEATLNPGEMLIQPLGWWHMVYADDPIVMSVSYFLEHDMFEQLVKDQSDKKQ